MRRGPGHEDEYIFEADWWFLREHTILSVLNWPPLNWPSYPGVRFEGEHVREEYHVRCAWKHRQFRESP
jgi:hypothetical protein